VANHWLEYRSDQNKDRKIGNFCFSTKHMALISKNKDWLAWNKVNVSKRVGKA